MLETKLNYLNCFCNWAKIYFLSLAQEDAYIEINDDRMRCVRYLLDKYNIEPASDRFHLKSIVDLCLHYQSLLFDFNVSSIEYTKRVDIIRELHSIIIENIQNRNVEKFSLTLIESTQMFKKVTSRIYLLQKEEENEEPIDDILSFIN